MYSENLKLNNQISIWLISMFWIISAMIVVGGLTRLTDSGLSITQWQLFSGFLPPLNNAEWIMYFDLYIYKSKYIIHSALLSGGKKPENNCHCVIDKPESVNLVKPPTTIIAEIIQNILISHIDI